jgi:hypothetical protein
MLEWWKDFRGGFRGGTEERLLSTSFVPKKEVFIAKSLWVLAYRAVPPQKI